MCDEALCVCGEVFHQQYQGRLAAGRMTIVETGMKAPWETDTRSTSCHHQFTRLHFRLNSHEGVLLINHALLYFLTFVYSISSDITQMGGISLVDIE